MFKKVDAKMDFPKMEESILKFWDEEKIFEKSVTNREGSNRYVFYDGPPFATGTPHYGHIVASVLKDVVPRYWTMRGFQVERRWGWDCHGLPIENIAEKELGIKRKKDIEEFGVAKFNEFCRSKVMEYATEWERVIPRIGRWADMKNAYRTMDKEYMESVWWVFKELWDKGLIYESYRSMHVCPRCETTLSQQEVAEGYLDVKDLSVIARFELVDEPDTFVLAWTTTPWTLPGNVALAIGEDIEYVVVRRNIDHQENKELANSEAPKIISEKFEYYIIAEEQYDLLFGEFGGHTEIVKKIKGVDLAGKKYKPLFDYYSRDEHLENKENGWKIYSADFVTAEEGTGIVHIAPAFGEDDMRLGKEKNLPFVQHVNIDGTLKAEVLDFAGRSVIDRAKGKADEIREIDLDVKKFLGDRIFSSEKYSHSYPHCWRCDTALLNYATNSWFVSVSKVKEQALENAKEIEWFPEHMKAGRFGKWLEGARDWSVSRQRYWASVMPIWKCDCGEVQVFGSVSELEAVSGIKVGDLHKHVVDEISFPCAACGKTMRRVPDVLDTWFDSGSMPYAQMHYPFENREKFESGFPAQFISEGVDQTRAWFYYLHVLSTAVKGKPAFQQVIVNGTVLAEDGKKMSKKLKNYPDPMRIIEKHGADALRLYLLSSPVVSAENFNFSERDLVDSTRNFFRMIWNSYSFFTMYANIDNFVPKNSKERTASENILDRWILSELHVLIATVNESMERYDLAKATRAITPFVDHLSNWYIRRSRKRFWKNENDGDKNEAYQTLYDVFVMLSKLMASFTPFLADEIFKNLTGKESVHLEEYPVADASLIDEKLNEDMNLLREIITLGLQKRSERGVKVRQPLERIILPQKYADVFERLIQSLEWSGILREELNVKGGTLGIGNDIDFDWNITPELQLEGEAREIIRAIQEGRKKAGFNVEDRIALGYTDKENVFEMFGELIAKEILAAEILNAILPDAEYSEAVKIDGKSFVFSLRKIG